MDKVYFLIAMGVITMGCSGKRDNDQQGRVATDSVRVFTLTKEPVSKALKLPAELYPWERSEIYAKVEGYVKELKVDIGDRVKRNQILVVLDAPEVSADFAKASADLRAAQAQYQTSLDTYKRFTVASQEKGAISDSEMDRIKNQMLSDSANYLAAKSSASAFNQMRNYLVIRSAFDGFVTQRNVDPGTLVGKAQTPLLIVENLHKMRLRVAVPEAYTSGIPSSEIVRFSVDAEPSKIYEGHLARKSNHIERETRTELWEFEVSNATMELKSGMYCTASFNLGRSSPSFVVPHSAVVTNLERSFVIRVRDNHTEWVDVRSGIRMKDAVEVFGDLQEGDHLVRQANDELKEGQTIVTAAR